RARDRALPQLPGGPTAPGTLRAGPGRQGAPDWDARRGGRADHRARGGGHDPYGAPAHRSGPVRGDDGADAPLRGGRAAPLPPVRTMISFKGRQIQQTFEEIVDPRHTALIVHELLNDFCAKGGAFDKAGRIIDVSGILPGVRALIAEARRLKIKLVYVRYTNHAD